MSRSLQELVKSFELSSYREQLLEQLFCAELLQGSWIAGLAPIEVDRPFVDFQGYDLVATCAGVTRHIQLKATRGRVAVHRALADKPSACVINMEAAVADGGARIALRYRFFGGAPGEQIDLAGLRPAKKAWNTRQADGEFGKAERRNHVVVPASKFSEPVDVVQLAHLLFGRVDVKVGEEGNA